MFISTRNPNQIANFEEAVFQGLSPDGGLYHFAELPDLTHIISSFTKNDTVVSIASKMTAALFPDLFTVAEAQKVAEKAFHFSPKLTKMDEQIQCLELYHGPTCAFKDFGASYLAAVMEHFLVEENKKAVILTATSGDTGSAVAQAFYNKKNIDVIILYPQNRVSPLQEKQLTTLGRNIHALEVKGAFDDCQRMVKEVFVDADLKKQYCLTSANSINIGRLIPQSFYYIWAYNQLKDSSEKVAFCVPSGNFGNLTAGLYANRWGLPVDFFLAATNNNDVVPEYLKTGNFKPRPSVKTLSNAMDVGEPSNFERMLALFNNDKEEMASFIKQEVIDDVTTKKVIKEYYEKSSTYIDPHTAVGYEAARLYCKNHADFNGEMVCLSTAHPAKFVEVVKDATGQNIELPQQLKKYIDKEKKSTIIEADKKHLISFLNKNFSENK